MFGDFETYVHEGEHKPFMFIVKWDDIYFENFSLDHKELFNKVIEQIYNTFREKKGCTTKND